MVGIAAGIILHVITHHERRSTVTNCSNVRHADLASILRSRETTFRDLIATPSRLPPPPPLRCLRRESPVKPGDPRTTAPLKQTQLKIKQQTIAQTRKMALLQLRVESKMPYRMGDQPANNSTSCLLCCPAATSID